VKLSAISRQLSAKITWGQPPSAVQPSEARQRPKGAELPLEKIEFIRFLNSSWSELFSPLLGFMTTHSTPSRVPTGDRRNQEV
jgi:hypothetical protein